MVGRPLFHGVGGGLELGEPTRIELDRGRIAKIASWGPSAAPELGHPDLVLAPALSDLHVHLMAAASARRSLDLSAGAPHSLPELFRVLREHADGLAPGAWLRAHGFDEFHLAEGRPPTAQELAAALPGRRVRLRHATLHASVLSVAGLKAVEQAIALSSDEATGFLVGREEELTTLCGGVDPSVRGEGLAELGAELVRGGIACVDDLTATNDANRVAVLAEAVRDGKIPQRVRVWLGNAQELTAAREAAGPWVEIAGVKLLPTSSEEIRSSEFLQRLEAARRAGLPVAIHAVEADVIDAAIDALLSASRRRSGGSLAPDRLEHCSLCPPHLIDRLARAGIAVVTQPGFLVARGAKYERWVEKPLWSWLYPISSLLRAGVLVAVSSDTPVIPPRPGLTFLGATTRRSSSGVLFGEEEAISDAEALSLCTTAAARVRGEPDAELPWLRVGGRADVALLERDPRGLAMGDWSAEATVIGGRPFGSVGA